jgi:hypothetical protein
LFCTEGEIAYSPVPKNRLLIISPVFSDTAVQLTYLDLETGDVIWVFEQDDGADSYAGIDPTENAVLTKHVHHFFL